MKLDSTDVLIGVLLALAVGGLILLAIDAMHTIYVVLPP